MRSTNLVSKIPQGVRDARSREPMERILAAGVGTGTLANPDGVIGLANLPTMTVGDGATIVADTGAVGLLDFPQAKVIFAGDADDATFNYQVILWTEVEDLDFYLPQVVAKGTGILGGLEYDYPSGTTFYVADTLTQTLVPRPGVYVYSAADDLQAYVLVDTRNAAGISVQTDIGTATAMEVFLQRGENLAPFELRQLAEYNDWRTVTKAVDSPAADANLFTVTGAVEASIIGVCSEAVVGAGGNASVGVSGTTQLFIPNTVNTAIDAGMVWLDATPAAGTDIADLLTIAIVDSTVLLTVGDSWATTGIVTFYCRWRPISPGALVVVA